MNKVSLIAILSSLLVLVVNSQSSPSQCSFNGFNYSNLNGSYTASGSHYSYFYSICREEKRCLNIGFAGCQLDDYQNVLYLAGSLAQGSFSIDSNGNSVLTYKTNANQCSSGVYRTIEITLICSYGPLVISTASESSCKYSFSMQGSDLCETLPTPTPTPNITETPTQTPSLTSFPTQTPTGNNDGSLANNVYKIHYFTNLIISIIFILKLLI